MQKLNLLYYSMLRYLLYAQSQCHFYASWSYKFTFTPAAEKMKDKRTIHPHPPPTATPHNHPAPLERVRTTGAWQKIKRGSPFIVFVSRQHQKHQHQHAACNVRMRTQLHWTTRRDWMKCLRDGAAIDLHPPLHGGHTFAWIQHVCVRASVHRGSHMPHKHRARTSSSKFSNIPAHSLRREKRRGSS